MWTKNPKQHFFLGAKNMWIVIKKIKYLQIKIIIPDSICCFLQFLFSVFNQFEIKKSKFHFKFSATITHFRLGIENFTGANCGTPTCVKFLNFLFSLFWKRYWKARNCRFFLVRSPKAEGDFDSKFRVFGVVNCQNLHRPSGFGGPKKLAVVVRS
jgi:hypothetical protein